jgi:hypothetical protein
MREIVVQFKMKVENVKIFRSGHKTRESCTTLYTVTNRLNKCQCQCQWLKNYRKKLTDILLT